MSRRGNPGDNATSPSFMKTLNQQQVYRTEYRDVCQGLLSGRARLRFTSRRTACDGPALPVENFAANGKPRLIRRSYPRGALQAEIAGG